MIFPFGIAFGIGFLLSSKMETIFNIFLGAWEFDFTTKYILRHAVKGSSNLSPPFFSFSSVFVRPISLNHVQSFFFLASSSESKRTLSESEISKVQLQKKGRQLAQSTSHLGQLFSSARALIHKLHF